jgi:hypothetical protein
MSLSYKEMQKVIDDNKRLSVALNLDPLDIGLRIDTILEYDKEKYKTLIEVIKGLPTKEYQLGFIQAIENNINIELEEKRKFEVLEYKKKTNKSLWSYAICLKEN